MRIRPFKKSDTYEAAKLISETYASFNRTEGSRKAVQEYIDFYNPDINIDKIQKGFIKSDIFLVAELNGKLLGLVRGAKNRVFNLFVVGNEHGKGIGKKLMEAFEKKCHAKGSKQINIKASLYSVPFYQKIGYKKTTGVRNFQGLKVQPLRKNLN